MRRPSLPSSWPPRTALLSGLMWLGGVVAGELVGGELTRVGWLAGAVMVVALVAWIVKVRLERRGEPEPADPPLTPRPVLPDLVGRSELLSEVVRLGRRQRLVLVHGPRGAGTSALALAAARELAPDEYALAYVDLRAGEAGGREGPDRATELILAALGPGPTGAKDDPYDQVATRLRGTGRVLVLDNARSAEQVGWLRGPVTGAYVLIAGDLPPWPGLPEVAVGPLSPEDGLAMLRADPAVAPRAVPRRDSMELARRYLKWPDVVVVLRTWLASNPGVGVRALLADLDGTGEEPSDLVREVFTLQTRGLSAPARQLVALLPHVPLTWLTDASVAALLDRSRTQAHRVLAELARRGLLVAVTPSRYRVPREARALGLADRAEERPAALGRLVAHYAGVATEQAEALAGDRERAAETWFHREEPALRALLRIAPAVGRPAASRLAVIADALDTWNARDGRWAARAAVAADAAGSAAALGDRDARLTALLRRAAAARAEGDLDAAAGHLHQAEAEAGPDDPRLVTARGEQAFATGDRAGAREEFQRALARRSRRDAVGRVVDQLDLAAALVAQDELDLGRRLLREAATLATDAGDRSGAAYAQELLGVVAARTGDPAGAQALWAGARLAYERLHDDDGQARCLGHQGGLLVGPDPDRARALLTASLALRGDRPGFGVALAHARLADLSADPAEQQRHRLAASVALSPWQDQVEQPAEVVALWKLLAESDN